MRWLKRRIEQATLVEFAASLMMTAATVLCVVLIVKMVIM